MRFGLVVTLQHPGAGRSPVAGLYADALHDAEYAEELGYDAILVGEHHFVPDGFCPAPLTVAAAMAARTKRIRVGTSILILPLVHPLRVAEEAAVVDNLSDGRLRLGVGSGYVGREFRRFGVDLRERGRLLEEGVRTVIGAWTGEDGLDVTPAPVQSPHPEVWLGVASPAGGRRAARLGVVPYFPTTPITLLERQIADYRDACAELGREPSQRVAIVREAFVAGDEAEAWERAGDAILRCYREEYLRWGAVMDADPATGERTFIRDPDHEIFRGRGLIRDRLLVGSPDDVTREIERYRELGVTDITLRFHHPGLDPGLVRDAMRRFAEQVAPAFTQTGAVR
jgi:alkanesulfonate monooxygenase SsuD/methylene tetrahydromethanopterin reductase-like flavin-dependent oxidoreductase (luciferase family)